METKEQLLNICELEQMKLLDALGDTDSRSYIAEWFGENAGEDIDTVPLGKLYVQYLEDFMRWQEDKSPEEIKEVIKGLREYRHEIIKR